jgi:cytochrome c556
MDEGQMKRLLCVLVVSGFVAAAALVQQPNVQAADACGEKGQPSCPLQGWMEKNMDPAVDAKDGKALAAALEKSVAFVPDPKWNDGDTGWTKLAREGAAAAKSGDIAAAKKSCKSCHKAWRDKYKTQFRLKPVKG